jgi:hypothetical protein
MKRIIAPICAAALVFATLGATAQPVLAAPGHHGHVYVAPHVYHRPVHRYPVYPVYPAYPRPIFQHRGYYSYYNGYMGYPYPVYGYRYYDGYWFPAAAFLSIFGAILGHIR